MNGGGGRPGGAQSRGRSRSRSRARSAGGGGGGGRGGPRRQSGGPPGGGMRRGRRRSRSVGRQLFFFNIVGLKYLVLEKLCVRTLNSIKTPKSTA